MPVRVTVGDGRSGWIEPSTEEWRSVGVDLPGPEAFSVDESFYVKVERVVR